MQERHEDTCQDTRNGTRSSLHETPPVCSKGAILHLWQTVVNAEYTPHATLGRLRCLSYPGELRSKKIASRMVIGDTTRGAAIALVVTTCP